MFESLARLLSPPPGQISTGPEVVAVSQLPPATFGYHTGDKFDSGFGLTELLYTDYWTLRARSAQLFKTNHFARGIIRRLLTAEIGSGLHLEADPLERILGMEKDSLSEWSEDVEDTFDLWGQDPRVSDELELRTFGAQQFAAKLEAFVGGDVLVVQAQHPRTGLPRVRLVRGENVRQPWPEQPIRAGSRIVDGVELDFAGRQVAYWIIQPDGTSKRLAAVGERSGRRVAWLVYGSDRRYGEVRGEPLLSIILQSLRELDRYRDSTLRKAVVNSVLAMFVTRDADALPSRGMGAGVGAIKRGTTLTTDQGGVGRPLNVAEYVPGLMVDFLQPGEDIKAGTQGGTDQAYGPFEEAVLQAIAWSMQIPPEILKLSFSSNYSASKAANAEFKIYVDAERSRFGDSFCQPIYANWLVSAVLQGRMSAPGLLESWRDLTKFVEFGAWTHADWTGHVKPETDPVKQVKALGEALNLGLTTYDRASREFNGTKFSRNARKQKREREQLEEAGIITPMRAEAAKTDAAKSRSNPVDNGNEDSDVVEDSGEEAED